eukprot:6486438-Prymnesium_polylepis.1
MRKREGTISGRAAAAQALTIRPTQRRAWRPTCPQTRRPCLRSGRPRLAHKWQNARQYASVLAVH